MAFGTKKLCPICGNDVKGVFKIKIKDKVAICAECRSKSDMDYALFALQSADDMKRHFEYREENKKEFEDFNVTRELKVGGYYFREDANKKLWYYSAGAKPVNPPLYRYDEIAGYEYTENGETVTKGGIGGAVIGGALFGATGAIVGSAASKKKSKTEITTMTVRLSLTNPYHNSLEFIFHFKPDAVSLISFLESLEHKAASVSPSSSSSELSSADEILKYKKLLDIGAITQEEYDCKKEQLLNL